MNKHTLEKYPSIQGHQKSNKHINWIGQRCLTKVQYPSIEAAERSVTKIIEKHGRKVNAYYCTSCLKFHLTKRKPA